MPFTLFHFGVGLGLGLPVRRRLHAPTFILANVIVDVEPLLVFSLELRHPLHGYLHTFLLALPMGLAFGYIMHFLERFLNSLYKMFLLEVDDDLSLRSFVIAGVSGTELHVLLDAPLYDDMKPLYPIATNPFYNPSIMLEVYSLCFWMGVFGAVYYLALLSLSIHRKQSKRKCVQEYSTDND
jgi:membrane-bound metal-dependent hydrolase YbcI (DUF457 family)